MVVSGWVIVFDTNNLFFLSSGGNERKIRTAFVRLT